MCNDPLYLDAEFGHLNPPTTIRIKEIAIDLRGVAKIV